MPTSPTIDSRLSKSYFRQLNQRQRHAMQSLVNVGLDMRVFSERIGERDYKEVTGKLFEALDNQLKVERAIDLLSAGDYEGAFEMFGI